MFPPHHPPKFFLSSLTTVVYQPLLVASFWDSSVGLHSIQFCSFLDPIYTNVSFKNDETLKIIIQLTISFKKSPLFWYLTYLVELLSFKIITLQNLFPASFLFSLRFEWNTKMFFSRVSWECGTERMLLEFEIRDIGGGGQINFLHPKMYRNWELCIFFLNHSAERV